MYITVERTDYPAIHPKNRPSIPAHYESRYICEGREIATYDSLRDVLYCRTDYIGRDFKRSVYERAVSCPRKEQYIYLFDMLGVNETSDLSEYTNF